MSTAAECVWRICLTLLVLVGAFGGLCDLSLLLLKRATISDYLRLHPDEFAVPVAILLGFLALLGLHLFVCPRFFSWWP